DEDEAAFRLRLRRPGVGEGAPARLELGETAFVTADGDRMLVHLQPLRLVQDAGDLDGLLAIHEPRAERDAVTDIVEQAAAAGFLLVDPGMRLARLHFLVADLDLVGEMIERTAVAVVEMHLDDVADDSLVDEALGGVVRAVPGERPVDGE